MATANYEFMGLSTREGFNRSLRHFKAMSGIVGELGSYRNIADILNEFLDNKQMEAHQMSPVINALLVGHPKYNYSNRSYNLKNTIEDFKDIFNEVGKWTSIDMVIAYFHPDLGFSLINPKNALHWDSVQALKKNELITIYGGAFADKGNEKLFTESIDKLISLLEGKKIITPASFTKGKFKQKAPKKPAVKAEAPPVRRKPGKKPVQKEKKFKPSYTAERTGVQAAAVPLPPTAAPSQKRRMTPMYSIPVTNELFHNGNVEAWKKIIQSYNVKYSDLVVFIFYEGERIHDINTLFKWGKVKHGSAILIAIAGENVLDVAKLRRYLSQGASPMFEAFLKFPVNTVLNLF